MSQLLAAGIPGFLLGSSLIIAIGAQNAFVLRLGLLKQHVFIICLICAFSDALLILLGIGGFAKFISQYEAGIPIIALAGSLFLFVYGFQALMRVFKPDVLNLEQSEKTITLTAAISTCLALTFLNPHVYLDTVILLGGIASNYEGSSRYYFGFGAALASFVWFFSLGYGARFLSRYFKQQRAWQILDTLIFIVMWAIAISLLKLPFEAFF